MDVEEWKPEELESVTVCPVCQSPQRTLLYDDLKDRVWGPAPGRWQMYTCLGCHACYLDPRPNAESIARAYRTYYTHTAPNPAGELDPTSFHRRLRRSMRNGYINRRFGYSLAPSSTALSCLLAFLPRMRAYAARLFRFLPAPLPGDTVLDIGCGEGTFLTIMRQHGWETRGLEPDQKAADAARSVGLNVESGMLTPGRYPPESFAAITMGHVLEHLHDPTAILRECYSILKPGGLLWIATPNLQAHGHHQFGPDWVHLDPPRHLVLFNADSLATALQNQGFTVETLHPVLRDALSSWQVSYSIQSGGSMWDRRPLPLIHRLQAMLCNVDMALHPGKAEELLVMARKPKIMK